MGACKFWYIIRELSESYQKENSRVYFCRLVMVRLKNEEEKIYHTKWNPSMEVNPPLSLDV